MNSPCQDIWNPCPRRVIVLGRASPVRRARHVAAGEDPVPAYPAGTRSAVKAGMGPVSSTSRVASGRDQANGTVCPREGAGTFTVVRWSSARGELPAPVRLHA
jgi:hypothetical protein